MTMGKRVLSLMLVLVLALGIMPMSSNAKVSGGDPVSISDEVTFDLTELALSVKVGHNLPTSANLSFTTTTSGSALYGKKISDFISGLTTVTSGSAVTIQWYKGLLNRDNPSASEFIEDAKAEIGTNYGLITLEPKEGFEFVEGEAGERSKITLNGEENENDVQAWGIVDGKLYIFVYVEGKAPEAPVKTEITEVKLDVPSKLEAGMTNKEAFDLFKVGDGGIGYEIIGYRFFPHDLNGKEIHEEVNVLNNNRIYRLLLFIDPKEEYEFGASSEDSGAPFGGVKYLGKVSSAITPYGIAYINGINELIVGYEYKIGGSNPNYYYPTYYAPTTKAPTTSTTETIPVTGNESASVTLGKVENGNAILGEFTDAVINAADGKSDADTNIVVNLSSKSNVTSATLTKDSVNKIASAINDDTNSIKGLEIDFAGGTAEFDAQAVNSINNQAAGDVTISITQIAVTTLSGAQQTAVSGMNVTTVVKSTVTSNGQTISNFNGGTQTISVNVSLTGRNGNFFHAYYVAADGSMTAQMTYFAGGKVNFLTNHNSEFVIVYDETTENNPLLDVYRLYNPKHGDHILTTNKAEYEALVKYGWNDEGVAFKSAAMNGTKVYRLFNAKEGMHFYTANEGEKTALLNYGWKYEGSMFVSGGEKNVYRVYNTTNALSAHIFTANEGEYKTLVANGWRDEGVAFKAN